MSIAGAVTGDIVAGTIDAVFSAAGHWVANGAVWLLDQVGAALDATTSVPVGSRWFAQHQATMAATAAAVLVPLVFCAVMQAVLRQSPGMVARAVLVQLPLAMLLTGVVVALVQMGLALTDSLSAQMLNGAGGDTKSVLGPLVTFLMAAGGGPQPAPAFVLLLAGLVAAAGALTLWLELVVRAAAVSAAVLFLPLVLAALVWPALAHWCRRLVETLVALVLSKLVVAAVLSLAAGAVAGGPVHRLAGGGFSAAVTGLALLAVAIMSPFTLLKLVPAVEGGAIAHLESGRHRLVQGASSPLRIANATMAMGRQLAGGGPWPSSAAGGSAGMAGATAALTAGASQLAPVVGEVPTPGIGPSVGTPVDLQADSEALGVVLPSHPKRQSRGEWYHSAESSDELLVAYANDPGASARSSGAAAGGVSPGASAADASPGRAAVHAAHRQLGAAPGGGGGAGPGAGDASAER